MADYVFADQEQDDELRRLRLIEAAFDGSTQELIQRTGLSTGWYCLEAGAGAGSILRWLGQQVGSRGRAVGVDKKVDYLRDLKRRPFTVVEQDIHAYEAPCKFDLIHVRYLLIHNRDALGLIGRLKDMLKPGGYLVLEEPDFETAEWLDDRYAAAGNRVNRAMCAMFTGHGLEPGYGSRLAGDVVQHGLSVMYFDTQTHLAAGNDPVALVMAESAFALTGQYLATGQAHEEDIARYIAAAHDPSSRAIYYSTVSLIAKLA